MAGPLAYKGDAIPYGAAPTVDMPFLTVSLGKTKLFVVSDVADVKNAFKLNK